MVNKAYYPIFLDLRGKRCVIVASPALAKEIRKELQKIYGPEYSRYLKIIKSARSKAMKDIPNKKDREKFLRELASGMKRVPL